MSSKPREHLAPAVKSGETLFCFGCPTFEKAGSRQYSEPVSPTRTESNRSAALHGTVKVIARGKDSLVYHIFPGDNPHRPDGSTRCNCAFTSPQSAAKVHVPGELRIIPVREDLARSVDQRKGSAEAVNTRLPNAGRKKEETTYIQQDLFSPSSAPNSSYEPKHGSSQFRWIKSLLSVFLPRKARENVCSGDEINADYCHKQDARTSQPVSQKHLQVTPSDSSAPDDVNKPLHGMTFSFVRETHGPQQSAEPTRPLDRVTVALPYASTQKPALHHGTSASSKPSGRCGELIRTTGGAPPVACSASSQPKSVLDQHRSPHGVTSLGEGAAWLANGAAEREAIKSGASAENTNKLCVADVRKTFWATEAKVLFFRIGDDSAAVADKLGSAPESFKTSTRELGKVAYNRPVLGEALSRTWEEAAVTTPDPCERTTANIDFRTLCPSRTAGEVADSTGGLLAMSLARSRRHENCQGCFKTNSRGHSDFFSSDVKEGAAIKVELYIFTARRPTAVQACCPEVALCPSDEAVLYERRSAQCNEWSTRAQSLPLTDSRRDIEACSTDSESTTSESINSECHGSVTHVHSSSVGKLPLPTPSPVSAASAVVDAPRSSTPRDRGLQKMLPWLGTAFASTRSVTDICMDESAAEPTYAGDTSLVRRPLVSTTCITESGTKRVALFCRRSGVQVSERRPRVLLTKNICVTSSMSGFYVVDYNDLLQCASVVPEEQGRHIYLAGKVVIERGLADVQDLQRRPRRLVEEGRAPLAAPERIKGVGTFMCGDDKYHLRDATGQIVRAGDCRSLGTATHKAYDPADDAMVSVWIPTEVEGVLPAPLLPCSSMSLEASNVLSQQREATSDLHVTWCSSEVRPYVSGRASKTHFTSAGSGAALEIRDFNLGTARGGRLWRDSATLVCEGNGSAITREGPAGRRRGGSARIKLLPFVCRSQRGRPGTWPALCELQEPDIHGGSVFLFTYHLGDDVSWQGTSATEELRAGTLEHSSSKYRLHIGICRGFSSWSARRERAAGSGGEHVSTSAAHLRPKGNADVASETNSPVQILTEGVGRYPRCLPPCRKQMSAPETTAPAPVTPPASVARAPKARASPAAASQSSGADRSEVLFASESSHSGLLPAEGSLTRARYAQQPVKRVATSLSARTVAVEVPQGSSGVEWNAGTSKSTHDKLLPVHSTATSDNGIAADTLEEPRGHILQELRENDQPAGRRHVWNGDSLAVTKYQEEGAVTLCRSTAVSESCVASSLLRSTSSSVEIANVTAEGGSKENTLHHVSRSAPLMTAPAVALPHVKVTLSDGESLDSPKLTPAPSAAFRRSCKTCRKVDPCNAGGGLLHRNRNFDTGNSDEQSASFTWLSLPGVSSRCSRVPRSLGSSLRSGEEHVQSNIEQVVSNPPQNCNVSPRSCSPQPYACCPSVSGAAIHMTENGATVNDVRFGQLKGSKSPAARKDTLWQLKCTPFSSHILLFSYWRMCTSSLRGGRRVTVGHHRSVYQELVKPQQQHRRRQRSTLLHGVRRQACERVRPEAARGMIYRWFLPIKQEQTQQLQGHQMHVHRHLQRLTLHGSLRRHVGDNRVKREFTSVFFQCRKSVRGTCVRDTLARSSNDKQVQESLATVRNEEEKELEAVLPLSSESVVTGWATLCGEGKPDKSVWLLSSAGSSADKARFRSDNCAGASIDASSCTRRQRSLQCCCAGQGREGPRVCYNERNSLSRSISASASTVASCLKALPVGMFRGTAACTAETVKLPLPLNDSFSLRYDSATERAGQQTNIVDPVQLQGGPVGNYMCPLRTADLGERPLSPSSVTVLAGADPPACGIDGSTCPAGHIICDDVGGVSEQNLQQSWRLQSYGDTGTESLTLTCRNGRSSNASVAAHEELCKVHKAHGHGTNSRASSISSVVSSGMGSMCENPTAGGPLSDPRAPSPQQCGPPLQEGQYLQRGIGLHDSTAAAANDGSGNIYDLNKVSPVLCEDRYEGGTPDTSVPAILDDIPALESYWEDTADEVNVYVPPLLHSLPQSPFTLFLDTTAFPADRTDSYSIQVSPRETLLCRTIGLAHLKGQEEARSTAEAGETEDLDTEDEATDIMAETPITQEESSHSLRTSDVAVEVPGGMNSQEATEMEIKIGLVPSMKPISSSNQTCLQGHAGVHCYASNVSCSSSSVKNSTRGWSSAGENCYIDKMRCSSTTVMFERHTEPLVVGDPARHDSPFTGSTTDRSGGITSGDRTGGWGADGRERQGGACEVAKDDRTHTKASVAGSVPNTFTNAAENLRVRRLSPLRQVDAQVYKHAGKSVADSQTSNSVILSSLSVPCLKASYDTPAADRYSTGLADENSNGLMRVRASCSAIAEGGALLCEAHRSLFIVGTDSLAEASQQKQQQTQLQPAEKTESDNIGQYEVKQQWSLGVNEKKGREKTHEQQQSGCGASSLRNVLHDDMHAAVLVDGCHDALRERRTSDPEGLSAETVSCCTWAATAADYSKEITLLRVDREQESAGCQPRGVVDEVKVRKQERNTEISSAAAGQQKHYKRICSNVKETSLACYDEVGRVEYSQEENHTGDRVPSTREKTAEGGRIGTNQSGTIIMQVKFSSLLLLLCDPGDTLLAELPYFEGPLSLSVQKFDSSRLRRHISNYPRPSKSVRSASAHVERLYYFVLTRGHLFWFTERGDFSSRGLDACVGSISLLLNACRIRTDAQSQEHHGKFSRGLGNFFGSISRSSECDRAETVPTNMLSGRDWTDRFLLQFYVDAGAWEPNKSKQAWIQSNVRRERYVRRIDTGITHVSGGCDTRETRSECVLYGELGLRVVSGAVFCATTARRVSGTHEEASCVGQAASFSESTTISSRRVASRSEASPVSRTQRLCRTGSLAAECASLTDASDATRCERRSKDLPVSGQSSDAASFAPNSSTILPKNAPCGENHDRIRRGFTTAAVGATITPSWLERLRAVRLGRPSAEKKAALASYAGAWVQNLRNSIVQGEELRRRFPQVNWLQHQLRARMVASRCGVF